MNYTAQFAPQDHGIDILHSHVFNTEAHPVSLFGTARFEELKAKTGRGGGGGRWLLANASAALRGSWPR